MNVSDVLACSFPEWYDRFAKVTMKSIILPLPDDVLSHLLSKDSLRLPKECDKDFPSLERHSDEEAGEDEAGSKPPSFPAFSSQIEKALEELGGSAFCKLNWSAPKDARWIAPGHSLKCEDVAHVYLLLMSSEFTRHDLTQPFKDCTDPESAPSQCKYHLVLRKWTEVNPATEFRCFARNGDLFAICQRDATHYYEHIKAEKESIITDIRSFFNEHIKNKFVLPDFVFDVHRIAKDEVKLIDFNPFGVTTDPILFSWEDLKSVFFVAPKGAPHFRCVMSQAGIQPSEMEQYAVPKDVIGLATGTAPNAMVDLLKAQREEARSDSSDSD